MFGIDLTLFHFNKFIPLSGCYNGVFDAGKPIIEQVYKLATSGSEILELDILGTMTEVMAVEPWGLLEIAAKKSHFIEVLSPQRNFFM